MNTFYLRTFESIQFRKCAIKMFLSNSTVGMNANSICCTVAVYVVFDVVFNT